MTRRIIAIFLLLCLLSSLSRTFAMLAQGTVTPSPTLNSTPSPLYGIPVLAQILPGLTTWPDAQTVLSSRGYVISAPRYNQLAGDTQTVLYDITVNDFKTDPAKGADI